MNILQVIGQRGRFGVHRYATELAKALSLAGHECQAVEFEEEPQYPFFAYNEYLQTVLEALPLSERMVNLCEAQGPFDALIAHDWAASQAAAVAHRLYGCPVVAVLHGTEPGRTQRRMTREQLYVAEMERWLCQYSEHIIVPSEFVRTEVQSDYQVSPSKISVAAGGVDSATFAAEVDAEDFRGMFAAPDESLILFAGRLEPSKSPELVLETFRRIVGTRPKTRLAIAGTGSMHGHLREVAAGLGDRVQMTGAIGPTVLGALYQVSDVLVIPSRYEALGISALEALLYDLPVVALESEGLREIAGQVGHRVSLVPHNSLSERVLDVLESPPDRPQHGPNNELIPKKYRWKETAKAVVRALEKLKTPVSA